AAPARPLFHHHLPRQQERARRRLRLVDTTTLAEDSHPAGRPRPRRLPRPGRGLRPGLPAWPLCAPDPLRPTARSPPPPSGQGVGGEDCARERPELISSANDHLILPRQQRRSYTNPKRERRIRCVSLAGASG